MRIKTEVASLRPGMYVAKLDRPWIESPFLCQGFPLDDDKQISEIRQLCKYVYVDAERSSNECQNHLESLRSNRGHEKPQFIDTVAIPPREVDAKAFVANAKHAKALHEQTRVYVDELLNDIEKSKAPDIDEAKDLVGKLVESLFSDAEALVWLAQLRNRDEYTANHSVNVCILALSLGRDLGLPVADLNTLGLGALLHDTGKVKVPRHILNKPGRLDNDELQLIRAHAFLGYEILRKDPGVSEEVLSIIRDHHERLDGSGYPLGIRAEKITKLTRIVSIVDIYDAMVSDRVYSDGMAPQQVLNELYQMTPHLLDEKLIQALIKCVGIYPVGSIVRLNSGHTGVVVKLNEDSRLKPVVYVVLDREGQRYQKGKLLNLASSIWHKKTRKEIAIQEVMSPGYSDISPQAVISEVLNS